VSTERKPSLVPVFTVVSPHFVVEGQDATAEEGTNFKGQKSRRPTYVWLGPFTGWVRSIVR
jgi:hypothetical protein